MNRPYLNTRFGHIVSNTQDVDLRRGKAVAVAVVLIIYVTGWLAFEIPKGILTTTDELFTVERPREMHSICTQVSVQRI